jgi:hypothetical protein
LMVSKRIGSSRFSIDGGPIEQRRCHDPSKHSRPFIGKSSSAVDDIKRHHE